MNADHESPLLSIAIPTHGERITNVARVVTELLRDAGRDFEVLVVDNCSPRNPAEVFEAMADDRVRFVRNPVDVGMVPNWNRCVALCRGRWVWIVHSDDQLVPNALSSVRRAIGQAPHVGMICFPGLDDFGNGRIVDRNVAHPRQPQRLDSGANAGRFLLTHALYCSGIIVRRDVYERIGAFDESLRYSADEEYWLRVAASFPVQYDPVRICVYRRGGVNSMMGTWTRPEFAALYRETLRKGLEHFQAIGSESHQELVRLAGLRMTRNWVVIAFLCLCDGEPHLATHYLDQYTKDRQGLPPDVREHIVRVLAALPRRISRTICRSLLRALTSKFALVGSRLVPR